MLRRDLEPDIPDYALPLISEIVEKTGYPIVVVETEGIGYDSLLSMAGKTQPFHQLAYVPEYREFLLHFIVNAAVKIRRVWDQTPGERLLPVSEATRLPRDDEAELRRKFGNPPTAVVEDLSTFLYHGILQQLTSMPLDIRIEREIAKILPEHHEAQHAYLSRQVRDLESHFIPEMAAVTPDRIYAASTAMNVVLAEEAAEIADVEPGRLCLQTPYRSLGKRLREQLHAVKEAGYRGDMMLTDAWAEELGLRDWYEWRRLDEVR